MKKILRDSLILLIVLLISGFIVFYLIKLFKPVSIEKNSSENVSIRTEKTIGKIITRQILIDEKVSHAPLTKKALSQMRDILLSNSEPFPFDINIILVNSNEVNAFALPGGTIIIYSGIFKLADDPEEVIAVLAHEMGHIYYRDSYNSVINTMGIQFLLSIITGGNSELVTELIKQLLTTKYSRKVEGRADKFALKLLSDSGIDPIYMAHFFEQMETLYSNDKEEPSALHYFETHPSGESRIEKAKKASSLFTKKETVLKFNWDEIKKEQPSFFN